MKILSLDGKRPDASERKRLMAIYEYEISLIERECAPVAGVDEAGRGPLAGPLVASAVVLPPGILISGMNDSKKLSRRRRERLFQKILECSLCLSTSIVDVPLVEELNVRGAANEAMRRAIQGLDGAAQYALIDGLRFSGVSLPHEFVIGGDRKCHSVAAASIIAKVTRDRIMDILDRDFPGYGFSRNKGYPTKSHRQALHECGPTPVHRMSFQAVKRLIRAPDRLENVRG
ncbi:MAG: ribonuclease HII [Candidatus Glassbacteria bacterium]